ncbi:two component transcriptional regulator, LuxR family [Desulfatibacillum alkenivorans DSM 16219]|jgi:DNA-binding NarL/FixJ family response regulator|uniref:Two component transcriptional regulator, LuxR family n=1 Tax=Desulfatibacillum alkenivorans DSM 16219 TaxID=1121393 RepID=A0A1M6PIV4_9BACT|nr:response regulator transcription factor [Desulfatibacillum alkenivorans]SHK07847.1 two component transcriptional regulator, LuxR family [Desulfatibacillum alkenivorans DSM 16219]
MQTKQKVVIAEDHNILRAGLRSLLEDMEEVEVTAEARDGVEAIQCVREHLPDLLLLDLSMPRLNGLSAINEIKASYPETKILVLTVHKAEDYILESFRAGADGYCLKEADRADLFGAIRNVLAGKRYLDPGIADQVLEGFIEGKQSLKQQSSWDTVTQREKEVLKLVGEGRKNKEIGDILCISVKTVEKHRANIMEKLNLHNASELTAYAIKKGLVVEE